MFGIPDSIFFLFIGAILSGAFVFFLYRRRPQKIVELLRPRDGRGKVLQVEQETDIGILCRPVEGVTHRFYKFGRGWVFDNNGAMLTKFFGLEARAYTALIRNEVEVKVSVMEYLKWLWGEPFYNAIPEVQKRKVETDVMGLTINVIQVDEDENELPVLSADDIHAEGDNYMMKRFVDEAKGDKPVSYVNYVVALGLGALLMYVAIGKGWF